MQDADFLMCLATRDLQFPNKEATEADLCSWVSQIIGPGSEKAVQRIHAKGFTTARAWQAIEHEDLQRAGFTTGDARALSSAVTNAMMSKNNAERDAIFAQLDQGQRAHHLGLDQLTTNCQEDIAKLDSSLESSLDKATAVLHAVSIKVRTYGGELAEASTTVGQENGALGQKCDNHVTSLRGIQQDVAGRVRAVVDNSGDRYQNSAQACKLAMDRISAKAFTALDEKIASVETRIESTRVH